MDGGERCDKLVSLKQGSDSSVVTLKWKGSINGMVCLGCELNKNCEYGTNGSFNGNELFECGSKRGVLIVDDNNSECCQFGKGHTDINTTGGTIFIDGACICCAETREKLESNNGLSIGKKIILKDTLCGTIKWMGVINGEECIGVEIEDYKRGTNGTFNGMKLFDGGGYNKCVLVKVHDIGDTIFCAEINTDVINPSLKWSIQATKTVDKYIVLRHKVVPVTVDVKWEGTVNDIRCIGCELPIDYQHGTNGTFGDKQLFKCHSNKGVIIKTLNRSDNFITGHEKHKVVTSTIITTTDDECICCMESVDKLPSKPDIKVTNQVLITIDGKEKQYECLWIGLINGKEFVGIDWDSAQAKRIGARFCDRELFKTKGNGILVSVDKINCESHKDITKYKSGSINIDSICCVETVTYIDKYRQMKIGSTIKYKTGILFKLGWSKSSGVCKWIGLVNGKEAVGVQMKQNMPNGTKGTFSYFNLFECKEGRGVIFLCDDIEHDVDAEKLHFVVYKFVDPSKICTVKIIRDNDTRGLNIGDYVSTFIKTQRGTRQEYNGEIQWMGIINGHGCVGIDLEDKLQCGMDGVINDKHRFNCDEGHGVITTMDNVELNTSYPIIGNNGIIDAKRYIRCEEKWDRGFLEDRNISKDGFIFVIIDDNGGGRWKKKGILRWCGTMNGSDVAVVELWEKYNSGTNGLFWRHQLIQCGDKRAIAVLRNNVHQYTTYEGGTIPVDKRIFKEIDVNTTVVYYIPVDGVLTDVYGTVRWSGTNDCGEYLYGIELDDEYHTGTDGEFNGVRLFKCTRGHGVLASMDHVAPDIRFDGLDVITPEQNEYVENKTVYIDSSVIDPLSVITIETVDIDEWIRGIQVEFRVIKSYKKYTGSLKWTGLINKIMSAVVDVDDIGPNDSLRNYLCSQQLCDRMNVSLTNNMVIVLLATVNKEKSCLTRTFNYINNKEYSVDILMEIINKEDSSVLKYAISEWKHPINLENYPHLLSKLIGQNNYDVIVILLDHFITTSNDSIHLLNVAKYFLLKGDNATFILVCNKCNYVDIIMETGDTFLTSVMRECDNEDIINTVIRSNIFDINKTNNDGDSPLVVACRKLMVSSVRLLVDKGASVSIKEFRDIRDIRKTITDTTKDQLYLEIIGLITECIRLDDNASGVTIDASQECSICLDRRKNTAFNCGHVACDICSEELVDCHYCRVRITDKRRIYLT